MFSCTRSRTGSCPFTSEKRVSRSSGMYVSMPPRERNQNNPPNCTTMNRKPNISWKMNGSAATSRAGASRRPSQTGSVLKMRPRTQLRKNRKTISLNARAARNRVQSSSLLSRWFSPPKTVFCQKR